ncbi:aryl-alcohol dehydrogenase-like predicted oxidoreductase [Litoreibacter meonggei]|uniref:Aryl-alcohol dehydrogenase-like predicted oxidoreductase n=1 Tax=Litoreibacter meonggei TaxID=1049199 RepID=A0A497W650_9RHOB|nr:aldo/keto reductase [Litoreibacter meonggei]RLJ51640.1 aryl-alcohol dehydrogenase-like predicted oxidoreductase [Litoreibacter meonggei]
MKFLDSEIVPLGMGCWPIGGAMYSGDQALGYTQTDDDESIRTIHAALDHGITLFDTAAAYGAGHSDRLLARALQKRPDAKIVSKIGIAIDEKSKQLTFGDTSPASVLPAIDQCLARLERDSIDLMLLHDNALPVAQAEVVFDEMEKARQAGKIRAFGWSTDFSTSAAAVAKRPGFAAVEHAMNVLVDAPRMQRVVQQNEAISLIRSPLAMGLLSGKYGADKIIPAGDIRASSNLVVEYFKGAQANPDFLEMLHAVRDLLTIGGRSLVQGSLGWIWAKRAANIPIPGARNVAQIEGIAKALEFGPLPQGAMTQIEELISRDTEGDADKEL